MDKDLLQLAQEAFSEWLRVVDDILSDAELSFEEFTGHGQRRELPEAGESLARAEEAVRQARSVLAAGMDAEPPDPFRDRDDFVIADPESYEPDYDLLDFPAPDEDQRRSEDDEDEAFDEDEEREWWNE